MFCLCATSYDEKKRQGKKEKKVTRVGEGRRTKTRRREREDRPEDELVMERWRQLATMRREADSYMDRRRMENEEGREREERRG